MCEIFGGADDDFCVRVCERDADIDSVGADEDMLFGCESLVLDDGLVFG